MAFTREQQKKWQDDFVEDFQNYSTDPEKMLRAFHVYPAIKKQGQLVDEAHPLANIEELLAALKAIDEDVNQVYTLHDPTKLGAELKKAGLNITQMSRSDILRYEAAAFMAVNNIVGFNEKTQENGEALVYCESQMNEMGGYNNPSSAPRPDLAAAIGPQQDALHQLAFDLKRENLKKLIPQPLTTRQKVALGIAVVLTAAVLLTAIVFSTGAALGGIAGGAAVLSGLGGGSVLFGSLVTAAIGALSATIVLGVRSLIQPRSNRIAPAAPLRTITVRGRQSPNYGESKRTTDSRSTSAALAASLSVTVTSTPEPSVAKVPSSVSAPTVNSSLSSSVRDENETPIERLNRLVQLHFPWVPEAFKEDKSSLVYYAAIRIVPHERTTQKQALEARFNTFRHSIYQKFSHEDAARIIERLDEEVKEQSMVVPVPPESKDPLLNKETGYPNSSFWVIRAQNQSLRELMLELQAKAEKEASHKKDSKNSGRRPSLP